MENKELSIKYRLLLLKYISNRTDLQETEYKSLLLECTPSKEEINKLTQKLIDGEYIVDDGKLETFEELQSSSVTVFPMYFPDYKTTHKGIEALHTTFTIEKKKEPINWNKYGVIIAIIGIIIMVIIAVCQ